MPASPLRGSVARADLLRLLAVERRERMPLDVEGDSWFGYVRRSEEPVEEFPASLGLLGARDAGPRRPPTALPLRVPFLHAIVERKARERSELPEEPLRREAVPLEPESTRPRSEVRLIDFEDLLPMSRLLPALRRHLGTTRAGPLDLERVIDVLAAGNAPRRLPRRSYLRWHPALVVVLDFAERLRPYREDMHRLAEELLRCCGRSGLSLRVLQRGPSGTWNDWVAHQDRRRREGVEPSVWSMPPAGTPVLLASDLGLLRGPRSSEAGTWRRFVAELLHARVRPLALAPLGASQLEVDLAQRIPVLRWSPDARMRPAHGTPRPVLEPTGLASLLALVAATRRVDPPLLRALRQALPTSSGNAGLEGALWCHADVQAGCAATIRAQAREAHLDRFRSLEPLHAPLDRTRRKHHAHLPVVVEHEETLAWFVHAGAEARSEPGVRERLEQAEKFLRDLDATLRVEGDDPRNRAWWSVAENLVQRSDERMHVSLRAVLEPLLNTVTLRAVRERRNLETSVLADPAALEGLIGGPERRPHWLVEDGEKGVLLLQAHPPRRGQVALGKPLELGSIGCPLEVRHGGGLRGQVDRRWLAPSEEAFLAELDGRTSVRIETATESITVAPLERPRGIQGWGRDREGLSVESPPLGKQGVLWKGGSVGFVPRRGSADYAWSVVAEPMAHAVDAPRMLAWGVDDEFGLHLRLVLHTGDGQAVQQLRWIEPGEFLMGSPENEAGRFSDEGPQHLVRITRGFFLADTACTQALWEAVMGKNPSRFKDDPERPVEQVSWDDVQHFLGKLGELFPGCEAVLPTEAQWEYACRAGTTGPFHFGAQVDSEQANFDGNYPLSGGKKSEYREKTLPVMSFTPNAWGLYQMHGNVWEWCSDGMRTYEDKSQEDPVGDMTGRGERVVRGGSWFHGARGLRSASRRALGRGNRYGFLGFRFSLRSIEPGTGPAAPGGRERKSGLPRDEAGPPRAERAARRNWPWSRK